MDSKKNKEKKFIDLYGIEFFDLDKYPKSVMKQRKIRYIIKND